MKSVAGGCASSVRRLGRGESVGPGCSAWKRRSQFRTTLGEPWRKSKSHKLIPFANPALQSCRASKDLNAFLPGGDF
jgi:hypothetical protein